MILVAVCTKGTTGNRTRVLDMAKPPPVSLLLQISCHGMPRKVSIEISFEEGEGLLSLTNWETEGPLQHIDQTIWPWQGK